MKTLRSFVFFLILILLLLSCNFPIVMTPTAPPVEITTEPTLNLVVTSTAEPTITPTVEFTGTCAYMWANQELPDVTRQLNDAFQQAGLSEVEARASAYGENCFDSASNQVVRFAAMQTDFFLTIAVPDTSDQQALGDWVEKIFPVIDQFPVGKVPGPNPGYIGIRFTGDPSEQNMWFQRQKARELLDQGARGSDLYRALLNQ